MELRHEILQENSHPWKKQIFFFCCDNIQKAHVAVRCLLPTEETEPNSIILEIFSIDKIPHPSSHLCSQRGFSEVHMQ